ncbi:hypothetical protein MVEN_02385300 [Mycena venus]|uniref:Uncharacterized protein n=1 Tax=Mycena venus TaxID=2733690 RepID=A0A8H6X2H0_9AGAR|nr:hypothetical protein MVEN_02385300 [Mycena venus]
MLHHHFRTIVGVYLTTCAGLLATGLNNHRVDHRGFTPEAIPITVPIRALQECEIHLPSILLFLVCGWSLDSRVFDTKAEIKEHDDFLYIIRLGVALLDKMIATTKWLGNASVCNPGTGLAIGQEEFLHRAGPADSEENSSTSDSMPRCGPVFNSYLGDFIFM